jgi:hypothetical protein
MFFLFQEVVDLEDGARLVYDLLTRVVIIALSSETFVLTG